MTVRKESTSVGVFRPEDAREIKKRVLGGDRTANQLQNHSGKHEIGWYYVILLEDLAVATNPLTGYTQATAKILFYPENTRTLDNVEVMGDPITVTNRSTVTSGAAGDLVLVKFIIREWAPIWGGGGGGGHTIWFTISNVLCPADDYVSETTLVVIPTWYNQSCTGVPPGANYEGTYDVYDQCNYLSGLTPDDLTGTSGRATYMYPLTGACAPIWIIDDLCAQPECL